MWRSAPTGRDAGPPRHRGRWTERSAGRVPPWGGRRDAGSPPRGPVAAGLTASAAFPKRSVATEKPRARGRGRGTGRGGLAAERGPGQGWLRGPGAVTSGGGAEGEDAQPSPADPGRRAGPRPPARDRDLSPGPRPPRAPSAVLLQKRPSG